MSNPLKTLIEKRLHELGKTARGASIEAGLGPDGIRNVFRGQSQSMRPARLIRLAGVLKMAPDDLLRVAHPDVWKQVEESADISMASLPQQAGNTRPIFKRGRVAAGRWLDHVPEQDSAEPSHIPRDPRYPHIEQYSLEVEGDSMNKTAQDGWTVVCVPYWEARRSMVPGDLVHVERVDEAGKHEFTLKRLKMADGGLELWPESTNPEYQEPVPAVNSDGYTVEIIGLVIGVYNPTP